MIKGNKAKRKALKTMTKEEAKQLKENDLIAIYWNDEEIMKIARYTKGEIIKYRGNKKYKIEDILKTNLIRKATHEDFNKLRRRKALERRRENYRLAKLEKELDK